MRKRAKFLFMFRLVGLLAITLVLLPSFFARGGETGHCEEPVPAKAYSEAHAHGGHHHHHEASPPARCHTHEDGSENHSHVHHCCHISGLVGAALPIGPAPFQRSGFRPASSQDFPSALLSQPFQPPRA